MIEKKKWHINFIPSISCICDLNSYLMDLSISDQLIEQKRLLGRQVAQSVERRTLEAEVPGSKPVLGTW